MAHIYKSLNINSRYLIIVILFLISFKSFSQDLNKTITLKIKNGTLKEVINEISNLAQINFSYSPQLIPIDKIISVKAKNKPIKNVLDEVLKANGIEYSVVENQIVLKLNTDNVKISKQNQISGNKNKAKHTISGYIKDNATGEILIGAIVYVKGTTIGTTTNAYGFYSLSLPEGDYPICFLFVGYKSIVQDVELKKNVKISIDLDVANIDLNVVDVVVNNYSSELIKNQLSEMKFTPKVLSQMPGFVGDVDVIKSLEVVPGINGFGDGSSLFYVRGGNNDQNLLMIDEAPIYNSSHLFGFFSALAPDAIKDVTIYKGDFPASYGNRLSSVIDIKSKDGNMRKFGASGSINPFTADLSVEGPIIKDKCSFFVSGRRSLLEWFKYTNLLDKSLSLMFFDVNAKINYKINDNNRVFLSFYAGKDDFTNETSPNSSYGIGWNNIVGTIRWNHIFNSKLFSNTTFYSSQYNYFLYISKENNDYWNSTISNNSIKTDITYYLNPKNTLKGGTEVTSHYSNPGNLHFADKDAQANAPKTPVYNSMEYAFYISNEQDITKNLSCRYGIRVPIWQDLGETTVFIYGINYNVIDTLNVKKNYQYANYISPEPRINIKYSINKNSSVKASYNRTTQFMQLLTNSTSPFNSLEVWAPCGITIKPQKVDQYAVGYFNHLYNSKFDVSVESYYKHFYNSIDYVDHANMLYNPYIEGQLRFGKAWSYGVEFMIRKSEGNFTGWLGYTYSRAFKQIVGVNNNNKFPAYYDRPNDICLNISYQCKDKPVSFSANWFYATGAAVTTPISFASYGGYILPVYSDKNNDRLPDYHRLDISATYKLSKPEKKYQQCLIFTVYNVYNRKNPISVNFNKIESDNGQYYVPSNLKYANTLVPTTMSVIGIVPSITYNFKF